MKTGLLFVCCLGLLISFANTACAAVIGSYTVKIEQECKNDIDDWITNLCVSPFTVDPPVWIFNGKDNGWGGNTGIDIFNNTGRTLWVSSNDDDPEFSQFVSVITDGDYDSFMVWIGSKTIGGMGYGIYLDQIVVGNNNSHFVDFQGYHMDRIGLTIDSAIDAAFSGRL